MTRNERVGMWLLVAGLAVCAYGASLRTSTLQTDVRRLAARTTSTSSTPTTGGTTTQPLEAAVEQLRREVTQLQANKGLSGPEVRALVETLLPAPGCVEPPCDATTAGSAGSTTTTTVKR